MPSTIIINIHSLINVRRETVVLRGKKMAELPILQDAFLIVENGLIRNYGKMEELDKKDFDSSHCLDAKGASVLPAWCDSHTHLVFAASREDEFVDKIKGLSYAEIAAKGGGILNSARKLNETSEKQLFDTGMGKIAGMHTHRYRSHGNKEWLWIECGRRTENASGN